MISIVNSTTEEVSEHPARLKQPSKFGVRTQLDLHHPAVSILLSWAVFAVFLP